jgi:hemoglobin
MPSPKAAKRTKSQSLYDRLGGIYGIAAVVNHFSDALLEDKIVGKNSANPSLRRWATKSSTRLPGLKWMRTLWVAAITGGPYAYVGTKKGVCPFDLSRAHQSLHISSAEFDQVARQLETSMQALGVGPKERQEVLQAFAQHKSEVVHGTSATCFVTLPKGTQVLTRAGVRAQCKRTK